MGIYFLTIIKSCNDLVDWIAVHGNANLAGFKLLMIGFKPFLASDVGVLSTIILNIGTAMGFSLRGLK